MESEYEKMERLYQIKLAKYTDDELDEELQDMLFEETVREVMASSKFNGGRRKLS